MSAPAALVAAPASPSATPGRLARAGTHVAVPLVLAAGLAWWDPARRGGPPLCPFAAVTGHACPGCGLTRAAGALLRGRVHDGLALHPLAPVLMAQVALACAAFVMWGTTARHRWQSWSVPVLLTANLALLLVTWVVRGLTGDLAGLA